jgi:enoyl-CoA hydratase/carnithine racemase
MTMNDFKPQHFNWRAENGVATITLKGAERKNPITFESYAELGATSMTSSAHFYHAISRVFLNSPG